MEFLQSLQFSTRLSFFLILTFNFNDGRLLARGLEKYPGKARPNRLRSFFLPFTSLINKILCRFPLLCHLQNPKIQRGFRAAAAAEMKLFSALLLCAAVATAHGYRKPLASLRQESGADDESSGAGAETSSEAPTGSGEASMTGSGEASMTGTQFNRIHLGCLEIHL